MPVLALLAALCMPAAIAPGCQAADDPCMVKPAGEVTAFLEGTGAADVRRIRATVVESGPPDESGFSHYILEDGDGRRHKLTYGGTREVPSLKEGVDYDFRIEYVPGMPSPSGIVITGDTGLLFAAASDYRPGARVLKESLPGFELELHPAECPNRSDSKCYDAVRNSRLEVRHRGETAVLYQGEKARLGPYVITCLIAQEVTYTDACADAGLFGVSYVIRRSPPAGGGAPTKQLHRMSR
jgi:hypothetical protein